MYGLSKTGVCMDMNEMDLLRRYFTRCGCHVGCRRMGLLCRITLNDMHDNNRGSTSIETGGMFGKGSSTLARTCLHTLWPNIPISFFPLLVQDTEASSASQSIAYLSKHVTGPLGGSKMSKPQSPLPMRILSERIRNADLLPTSSFPALLFRSEKKSRKWSAHQFPNPGQDRTCGVSLARPTLNNYVPHRGDHSKALTDMGYYLCVTCESKRLSSQDACCSSTVVP